MNNSQLSKNELCLREFKNSLSQSIIQLLKYVNFQKFDKKIFLNNYYLIIANNIWKNSKFDVNYNRKNWQEYAF